MPPAACVPLGQAERGCHLDLTLLSTLPNAGWIKSKVWCLPAPASSSPNLLAPSVHPPAPHITSHHLHVPLFYFCYTSLNCPPYAELGCLRAFAQTLSIARGALSTTVHLFISTHSLSLHWGSPSAKMPFPAPGTRLSLSLCSPAPEAFPPQHLSQFVIAHFIYIITCLLRELWPRAWTRESDCMSLQRSFPSHQLCGLGQVPASLCAALVSLSVQQASQMTFLWHCCESHMGLCTQALRTAHSS